MKTVTFMSRERAEGFVPPENAVIISISTPFVSFPKLSEHWCDVLQWHRADDDSPVPENEVQRIVDFVKKHEDKEFFVHCDAGISRSAAVALAIAGHLAASGDVNVKGLDCDTTFHANAVIRAALMRPLWEAHFREDHIERLCFKEK